MENRIRIEVPEGYKVVKELTTEKEIVLLRVAEGKESEFRKDLKLLLSDLVIGKLI